MSWQGGVYQFGDRVDAGHARYPRGFNKKNVAFAKGNVLFVDPADGNLRLATTGDMGPFYVAYNASLGSDPKQHCWYENETWLLLEVGSGTVKPGAAVIPNAGKVVDRGSNITTGVLGFAIGVADQDAELNSNNVINATATTADKLVVRMYNVVRLPIA